MEPTAFPLTWPDTMPRTKTPVTSQFRTQLILAEIERLDRAARRALTGGQEDG